MEENKDAASDNKKINCQNNTIVKKIYVRPMLTLLNIDRAAGGVASMAESDNGALS